MIETDQIRPLPASRISAAMGMDIRTFYYFAKRMGLTYQIKHKVRYYVPANPQTYYLLESISIAKVVNTKPTFTLAELARKLNKNRLTVLALLKRCEVPIFRNGQKYLVFLCHLNKLR